MQNPLLYEISTLPWLYELANEEGKWLSLSEVPNAEWDRLARQGFNLIWLMGMWKKSPEGRRISLLREDVRPVYDSVLPGWTEEDVLGSPYSIQSYEPDPAIGTWQDLKSVREKLKSRGMGLILDFVPNHTGPDHPWVASYPERFVVGPKRAWEDHPESYFRQPGGGREHAIARGRDPYFDPWPDTAQLNYFAPQAREAMLAELSTISGYCDGVRCDMAMLVLNDIFSSTWKDDLSQQTPATEFWQDVRKEFREFTLIAEAYWGTEGRLLELGFDYVYDKTLYDRCRFAPATEIREHLQADPSSQASLVRFLENHDERRAAEVFEEDRLRAAAILTYTLPGLKLVNHGQMEGRKLHLPVQLARTSREKTDSELLRFYGHLLDLRRHPNFAEGAWSLLQAQRYEGQSNENLIAYCWSMGEALHLVVVNQSPHFSQARIPLEALIGGSAQVSRWRLTDLLTGQHYDRARDEMLDPGLHVILNGFQCHVFAIEALER